MSKVVELVECIDRLANKVFHLGILIIKGGDSELWEGNKVLSNKRSSSKILALAVF